ncbi:uncharacterized protein [Parasteatoda tepidariorum]|uniref:uncharacterized protein n=1 Tax=Parasteatoda tepidariorum TaxID=114398 RepID=UPI001C727F99|nr:C-1-tetrahydrofolate synthase, cytoplasmic [Parasteatoda tepidariorum]
MDAIKSKLSALRKEFGDVQPLVAVLKVNQVGDSIPSNAIRGTLEAVGVSLKSVAVDTGDNDSCVYDAIAQLNKDSSIHGILVELPYDFSGDHQSLFDSILPAKDITGLSRDSVNGFLRRRTDASQHGFSAAILELIKKLKPSAMHGNICIVGFKNPSILSQVLIEHNSVVTVCRNCDEKLPSIINNADVIISISLVYEKIKQWMKPNSILISCSLASTEEQDLNTENHIVVSNHTFYAEVAKVYARNLLQNIKNLYDPEWSLKSIPLKFGPPGQSDLDIARAQQLKHIADLAKEMNLFPHEIELYGYTKCKVSLSVLDRLKTRKSGKYVVVAGITPTPLGEGKSTTAVGLCQALAVQMKRNTIVCLRQPSQGPTFGIKGGAAGGGYSQVVPMEEFNLHLTGDTHAVTAANNLLAAQIDARIFHEATATDDGLYKRLVKIVNGKKVFSRIQIARLERIGIQKTDPDSLTPEEIKKFCRLDIDPSTVSWYRVIDTNDRFLRKIHVGLAKTEKEMCRETRFDIAVASELMAILALTTDMADMKEKISKIVVANDRSGNPVTADDLGVSGALAVLMKDAINPNLMQTLEGAPVFVHAGPFANIAHGNSSIIADKIALKLVGKDGFVVFRTDTDAELSLLKTLVEKDGARSVICKHFTEGSKGAKDLAQAVIDASQQPVDFKFLYDLKLPIAKKIEIIAKEIYGADGVEFDKVAQEKMDLFEKQGFGGLPVCMAKTPLSISHDPAKKGVPTNFVVPIQDIKLSAGAGFVYPLLGAVLTMPGLTIRPCFYDIDIDPETGDIEGLS